MDPPAFSPLAQKSRGFLNEKNMPRDIIFELSGDIADIELVHFDGAHWKSLKIKSMYKGSESGGCCDELLLTKTEAKLFIQELTYLVDQMED